MVDILAYKDGVWVEKHDMQIFDGNEHNKIGQGYVFIDGQWDPFFETKFEYLDGENEKWKAYSDSNDVGGVYK